MMITVGEETVRYFEKMFGSPGNRDSKRSMKPKGVDGLLGFDDGNEIPPCWCYSLWGRSSQIHPQKDLVVPIHPAFKALMERRQAG